MTQRRPPSLEHDEEETLGSYYMGRMEAPPENRRVLPRGLLASITLVAFVGMIWYAYPEDGPPLSAADVPLIAADTAVYKFVPENPGGAEVRHQDSTVFDPLVRRSTDEVERLLPQPEQPLDRPQLNKPDENISSPPAMAGEAKGLNLEAKASSPLPGRTAPEKAEAIPAEAAAAVQQPAKPPPRPVAFASSPQPEKTGVSPVSAVSGGIAPGYYLQLGSFRAADGAAKEWRTMQSRFAETLGRSGSRVERADLGSKGVWYRLYAGPMTESRAQEICAKIKAGNAGACIVRKL